MHRRLGLWAWTSDEQRARPEKHLRNWQYYLFKWPTTIADKGPETGLQGVARGRGGHVVFPFQYMLPFSFLKKARIHISPPLVYVSFPSVVTFYVLNNTYFFFLRPLLWHVEVPRRGVTPSCRPTPQPQQCRI